MNNENDKPSQQNAKPEQDRDTAHTAEQETAQPSRGEPFPEYDSFMRIIRR
jgi:hypothetical protein